MPIREHCCTISSCDLYCVPVEHFFHNRDAPNPPCDVCGGSTERAVSRFYAPFTGDLGRFNDPNIDMHNATPYGHIAYRTKSSRMVDGSPEMVHIDSRAAQKQFIKDEQLVDPSDVNPNIGTQEDGKISTSRQKGSWV